MGRGVLAQGRIRQGVWEAWISGARLRPAVEAVLDGAALPGLTVAARAGHPGDWHLRLPLPPDILADGVQTVVIREAGQDEALGQFSIFAGTPPEADMRAEIDLLRAELDLLKQAFRRHCMNGAG